MALKQMCQNEISKLERKKFNSREYEETRPLRVVLSPPSEKNKQKTFISSQIVENKIIRMIYKMLLTIAIMTMYLAAIFPIALCYILLLLGLRKLKNWIMLNYNRTIWLLQNMLFKQLVVLEIDLCDYSKAKDVLVISNHQAVLDCLGLNYILHCNTRTKYIYKDSLKFIPIFYQICSLSNFLRVCRCFEKDKDRIETFCKRNMDGCYLVLFPEGTRLCRKSAVASVSFCNKNKIERFKNVLCPRYKGYKTILNSGNFSHILDVTMCWHEKKVPSLLDLFKLQERRLEIKTELIEVTKECESKEYLFELFRRKDALIECMKSRRG